MQINVDGWTWMKVADLGDSYADKLRRKLTLVESAKRSAYTHRAYQERDGMLGIPRAFFMESATVDHEIAYNASDGLFWPERIEADPSAPWASAQDGGQDDLVLVDSVTGEKSADFFSKDQKTGITRIMESLAKSSVGDGIAIFSSEQGAAKVCLSLIRSLKRRTLVITPPGASFAMWKTVVGRYLPDARVGTIRRGDRDEKDAHVTIGTLDDVYDFISHSRIESDEFGFVISHLANKMDPMTWTKVVPFFTASKRLGVVGPEASFTSGMSRVFSYHLGQPVFCADPDLETPKVRRVWSTWKISSWAKVNPKFISKETLMDHMCQNATYNQQLVEQVLMALKADRKIVIASERVAHLRLLKMQIDAEWAGAEKDVDFMIDGMPPDDISKASESDVILTTYSYVKSLPEMPDVDTVLLATPVRDPLSTVRVCLSKHPSKKPPVIVDMRCDDIPVCKEFGKLRDEVYRSSFGIQFT
jgi:hypothetical protein